MALVNSTRGVVIEDENGDGECASAFA